MKERKSKRIKNQNALRRGSYTVVITVLIIVAILVFNVLATALAQRFPLNLDLTANNDYSVSAKNIEYIKGVERPVTITVCADADTYASDMQNYAASLSYYGVSDSSGGKYYTQALALLEDYTKYNSNITLTYADPYDPSFANVQARATSGTLSYGSILVESTFALDGQEISRNKVLAYEDLYNLTTSSSSYQTVLEGSNVESAVTSAIYSVTSDKTTEVAYIGAHMDTGVLDSLNDTLESNNYNVTAIDNLLASDIPEETEILLIAAPTTDYSAQELAKLDDYLDNDGQRGKTLLFFASASSPDLPNLYSFLDEWGISILPGTVYETNTDNYIQTPATIGLNNLATEYTASANSLSRIYVATNNLPMRTSYESDGNRVTTALMQTGDTTVIRPNDADDTWSTSDAVQDTFDTAILSVDTIYDENYTARMSYVAAFSSEDFISEAWASQYAGLVGNTEFVLSLVNNITGRDATDISFTQKTIESSSFTAQVTVAKSNVVLLIFVIIIPLAVIVTGIIIWIRRRNR